MTDQDFKTAIQNTELFKSKPIFSKNILMKYRMPALYEYYLQSIKYGIEYLKGNPNILQSEVKLINEVLNKEI